jgi:serine protease Do
MFPKNDKSQLQNPPQSFFSSAASSRKRHLLLGAVAIVTLSLALPYGQSLLSSTPATFITNAKAQTVSSAPLSFADVVERVRGAVVSVKVKTIDNEALGRSGPALPRLQPGDPLERFFRQFGEPGADERSGRQARPRQGLAQGSGFIISADGYVVTNNHVIDHAQEITLTLDGGKTLEASLVGVDPKTDLALLKIKQSGTYPYVEFATASPRVGDWVIAVGNPFGLGGTVTAGIVSARGRDIGSGPYDDYLQIDAPVNRGNSGGPTFNAAGQVVGVNTAIYSPSGGSVGIGFAIPAEVVRDVVADLRDKGSVARGWLGVQIQPVTDEIAETLAMKSAKGALVSETQNDSPASKAGLRSGDVITAVNGGKIENPRELSRRIAALGPDKSVELTYLRDGSEKTLSLRLGALPSERQVEAKSDRDNRGGDQSLTRYGLALAPAKQVSGAGSQGLVVTQIDPDGPAAQKQLQPGDVILQAGGQNLSRPQDLIAALDQARKQGRKAVLLKVKSEEATRFVALSVNPAS